MAKWFFIFFCISKICFGAQVNPVVYCLGQEEKTLHDHKLRGALYRLNQDLIEAYLNTNTLPIKKENINEICDNPTYSPSLSFFKLALEKGVNIFENTGDDPYELKKRAKSDFILAMPDIFLNYLSQLESILPVANCLSSFIPEVRILRERMLTLAEHWKPMDILSYEKTGITILSKLTRLDDIYDLCEKLKINQEKSKQNLGNQE